MPRTMPATQPSLATTYSISPLRQPLQPGIAGRRRLPTPSGRPIATTSSRSKTPRRDGTCPTFQGRASYGPRTATPQWGRTDAIIPETIHKPLPGAHFGGVRLARPIQTSPMYRETLPASIRTRFPGVMRTSGTAAAPRTVGASTRTGPQETFHHRGRQ